MFGVSMRWARVSALTADQPVPEAVGDGPGFDDQRHGRGQVGAGQDGHRGRGPGTDEGAAVVGQPTQPVDQRGARGGVARPDFAQEDEGGAVVDEARLLLGHRAPLGVLVVLVALGAGQLEALADVRAEDGDLGDAHRVLGLLEEAVEQVAELGGEGVRAVVERGQGHQERLVAQMDRRLVLLEPLLDLVLQGDQGELGDGLLADLAGRVPAEQLCERGHLAQLVAPAQELGDVGQLRAASPPSRRRRRGCADGRPGRRPSAAAAS